MDFSKKELLSHLRDMDEYDFEYLVADIWKERGWQTTVTTASGDRGIDVIAEKNSPFTQKQIIQAKRYSADNRIGSEDIQQYSSLKKLEDNVDTVVIVTTSSFTPQAEQMASDLNVKLIDGTELTNMIKEQGGSVWNTPFASSPISAVGPASDSVGRCPHCGEVDTIWKGRQEFDEVYTILKCGECATTWAHTGKRSGKMGLENWARIPTPNDNDDPLENDKVREIVNEETKRGSGDSGEGCFIATAAYGTPKAKEIDRLRDFRDEVLLPKRIGRFLVRIYYLTSPPVAEWISRKEWRRTLVRRIVIDPSLRLIEAVSSSRRRPGQ